jgi:hypothetical protein
MADFQPPPTWADVILFERNGSRPMFNPVWLNWFLELIKTVNTAGGAILQHNDLAGMQGGSAAARYHLLQAEQEDITKIVALAAGLLVKTAANSYAARSIVGTANQVAVANGSGAAGNPALSLSVGDVVTDKYTPALSNVLNLAASTAYECQYLQVGNRVLVSGKVDVDPTAAGSAQLGIALPIASNFGAAEDCAGTAFCPTIAAEGAAILADAANNRAQMEWIAVDVTNQPRYFTFMYDILP